MKSAFFRLSAAVLAALCVLLLCACGADGERRSGDFIYTVENGEATITEYRGNDAEVVIPETIRGVPVCAIGDWAFSEVNTVESVTIPDSVVRIGRLAFDRCDSLTQITLGRGVRFFEGSPALFCPRLIFSEYQNGLYLGNAENPYMALAEVTAEEIETLEIHPDTVVICGLAMMSCKSLREIVIPEGVVSIGALALHGCTSLTEITLPASLGEIGDYAFTECVSLREIRVDGANPCFVWRDQCLFSRDGTRLIRYAPGQTAASYRVPEGTAVIESDAFQGAEHLTEVHLPDSVTEIGDSAFLQCVNLQQIHLGEGVKQIGASAFSNCSSLTEIVIPDSTETLQYDALWGCKKLETAVIGSGVTRIEREAFSGCDALREISFRDPSGWRGKHPYAIFLQEIDLSDPQQNAEYFTEKYRIWGWTKR